MHLRYSFWLYVLGCFATIALVSFLVSLPARAEATSTAFADGVVNNGSVGTGQIYLQEFHTYASDPSYLTHIDINNDWAEIYVCRGGIEDIGVESDDWERMVAKYDCEGSPLAHGTCFPMDDFATTTRSADFYGRCVLDYAMPIQPDLYYFAVSGGSPAAMATTSVQIGAEWIDGDPLEDAESALGQYDYDGLGNNRIFKSWIIGGTEQDSTFRLLYSDDNAHQYYPDGYDDPAARWIWDNVISVEVNNFQRCELGSDCNIEYRYNQVAADTFGYGVYLSYADRRFSDSYLTFQYFDERSGLVPDYPGQWWNTLRVPQPVGEGNTEGLYHYELTAAIYPPDSRDFVSVDPIDILWVPAGTFVAEGEAIAKKIRPAWCDATSTCGLTDFGCGLHAFGRWLICPSASTTEMVQEATNYAGSKFPLNFVFSTRAQFESLSTSSATAISGMPFIIYDKNGQHRTEYLMDGADWDRLGEGKYWLFKLFDTIFYGMGFIGLFLIAQRIIGKVNYQEGMLPPESERGYDTSGMYHLPRKLGRMK